MKIIIRGTNRNRPGFTLVELLTVIAIIGILAALLLTVIPRVIRQAKINRAKMEISQIVAAIQGYENAYGHFPVATAAQTAANPDFTYGANLPAPSAVTPIGTPASPTILVNDQVTAILMCITNYPGTVNPTSDPNDRANPQKTVFLTAKMTGDTSSSGVGSDLVYRDPWGNPYLISLDLNDDGICEDAFYKSAAVSTGGINGLILQPDGNYGYHGKIMVWSAGPDGKVNPAMPANQGENKDNVLSWQ